MNEFTLTNFLPYRLNEAAEKVNLNFSKIYKDQYGMTRPEWRVLANLGSHSALTAKQVGALSNMHKTKVSRAVFALENRRWLKRQTNENDKREENLTLTKEGLKAYHKLSQLGIEYNQQLSTLIGEQAYKELVNGLNMIDKNFNK